LEPDLAHVRDVEDTDAAAHGAVLRHDALVLDRHLESGEGNHLGAEGRVAGVERRSFERGSGVEHPQFMPEVKVDTEELRYHIHSRIQTAASRARRDTGSTARSASPVCDP